MPSRQETGRRGESLAATHLRDLGWRVRDRNWRCRMGEIDIVAEHEGCLVVVEVRTRRSDAFGTAAESVTPRKQARLRRAGWAYVQAVSWTGPWRIDVVTVRLRSGRPPQIAHYENAIGGG